MRANASSSTVQLEAEKVLRVESSRGGKSAGVSLNGGGGKRPAALAVSFIAVLEWISARRGSQSFK